MLAFGESWVLAGGENMCHSPHSDAVVVIADVVVLPVHISSSKLSNSKQIFSVLGGELFTMFIFRCQVCEIILHARQQDSK